MHHHVILVKGETELVNKACALMHHCSDHSSDAVFIYL